MLCLTALIFTNLAFAQARVFTTINSDAENIYAGVKIESKGMEPETYLLEVSGDKLSSAKVSLPNELIHREIIGLFPAEKNMVVVLTQRTIEQGDKPLFHSYNVAKKEWKRLAEVDCISFAKLKIQASSVTFSCSETNKNGEEIERLKKVTLSGVQLKNVGEMKLPLIKTEQGNLKAELLGEIFEWKELKIEANNKHRTLVP